jgi:putative nucleotidyltransferase with HDIG domain
VARGTNPPGGGWQLRLDESLRSARVAVSAARAGLAGRPLGRLYLAVLGLLATAFFALALAVLDFGAPPLQLAEGSKVRANVYARVAFRYEDPAAYNQARKDTPNVYLQEPDWAKQVRGDLDRLAEAKDKAKDLEEFKKLVAEQKLLADPKLTEPLWTALDGFDNVGEDLLAPIGAELSRLEELGILQDDRAKDESGRKIDRRNKARPDKPLGEPVQAADCWSEGRAGREIARSIDRDFKSLDQPSRDAIKALIQVRLRPSLVYDRERSEAAQAAVDPAVAIKKRSKGDALLRSGELIGPTEMLALRAENRAYWAVAPAGERLSRTGGLAVLLALLLGAAAAWMLRTEPESLRRLRQLAILALLGAGVLAAARVAAEFDVPAQAAPVILFAMVGAMVFSARAAGALVVLVGVLAAAAGGGDLFDAAALSAGALAAALAGARPRHLLDVLKAALIGALVASIASAAGALLGGTGGVWPVLREAAWALSSGLVQGLVLAGALPLLGPVFDTTTSISLRELCDQNHPLLRGLFLNAPGSHQHSLVTGMLSESAAEAVGANALLARAGGYYHDIGKIARPEYFIENAPPGENRHDRLSTAMSAMVVIAHVRDGAEMAREYRLPRAVVEIVEQHHGTTLAEFFYRRAVESGEPVNENLYRYSGPRPRSREAAIVLLADAVEATSRSLEAPSVARIESMVRDLSRRRLLEGQFDECDLTLRELAVIEITFTRILASMFHVRVAYPSAAENGNDKGNGNGHGNGAHGHGTRVSGGDDENQE